MQLAIVERIDSYKLKLTMPVRFVIGARSRRTLTRFLFLLLLSSLAQISSRKVYVVG